MVGNVSQMLNSAAGTTAGSEQAAAKATVASGASIKKQTTEQDARAAFDKFVGNTFYGQMLKAMRSTVDKPAYFDGGRAEEMFQNQLDQVITDHMTEAKPGEFTGGMFNQFWNDLSQRSRL
jgi:hypothetical protein